MLRAGLGVALSFFMCVSASAVSGTEGEDQGRGVKEYRELVREWEELSAFRLRIFADDRALGSSAKVEGSHAERAARQILIEHLLETITRFSQECARYNERRALLIEAFGSHHDATKRVPWNTLERCVPLPHFEISGAALRM